MTDKLPIKEESDIRIHIVKAHTDENTEKGWNE